MLVILFYVDGTWEAATLAACQHIEGLMSSVVFWKTKPDILIGVSC